MKKFYIKLFCLSIIMWQLIFLMGCHLFNEDNPSLDDKVNVQTDYSFDYFDTVSYIYSYANDEEAVFKQNASEIKEILRQYHFMFDIYHEYNSIVNLCTINKNAGKDPVVVDNELIDFLIYCKELYKLTNGKTNIMLGSVLKVWHDARTNASNKPSDAYVPDMNLLKEANQYTSIDLLEIDKEKKTVRIADPKASIDVGAIGKGYATELAARHLETKGVNSYVLNIGGNLRIIGSKINGDGWMTGITDPHNKGGYSLYTKIKDTSCVTSGDYERYYTVDGMKYHHIIDPNTLMPANYFSSITIFTKNSGLADALSTALFCMSYEEGLEVLEKIENVEVIWIDKSGNVIYTDGVIPEERK